MAENKKYFHNIDAVNNKVMNLLLNPLTTAQRTTIGGTLGTADEGYVVWDIDLDQQFFWDGTAWVLTSGTTPDLQQVTNVGNTTTNDLIVVNGNILTHYKNGSIYRENTITGDDCSIIFPLLSNKTWTFPLNDGYIPVTVNGVPADITGEITIPVGTGTVLGSGTLNYLSKWTPDGITLGDSLIYDDGSGIMIGTTTNNSYKFDVNGTARVQTNLVVGPINAILVDTNYAVRVNTPMSGAATAFGVFADGEVQSDVVNNSYYFRSYSNVAATTFTLGGLNHFSATQGTFGLGSTVTSQYGFRVFSSLVGATNNYGFYGDIPSTSTNWNLYMPGTAKNYLAGNTLIGTSFDAGYKLDVLGQQRFSGISTSDGPTLGSELVATGWTSTNWTGSFATGWIHTTGFTTALTNSFAPTVGQYYYISWTVTGRTLGTFQLTFGGQTYYSTDSPSQIDHYTSNSFSPKAISVAGLVITPTSDFNGTITISVKQITAASVPTTIWANSAQSTITELRANNLNNLFIGNDAGKYNRVLGSGNTGLYNTAVGPYSLQANSTGYSNTSLGGYSLYQNTTGYYNVAVGGSSLQNNIYGNYNSAVGTFSLYRNTGGQFNTALGYRALYNGQTASYNTAVGYFSSNGYTAANSGQYNSTFGMASYRTGNGSYNTILGANAGYDIVTGDSNIFIGYNTGIGVNNSSNNTIIGSNITIGTFPTGTNNWILIADGAGNVRFKDNNTDTIIPRLAGSGTRMVTAGTNGELSTATIPTGGGGLKSGTASGTDTYTVTISGVTSYADQDAYLIRFTNGNTTSCTLNISGVGAVPLYRNNDGALIGGDIVNGAEMLCIYNSTLSAFQCIGVAPNTLIGYVTNGESIAITKGQPVYAFSGTGDRMVVKLAYNTGDATSAQTVGIVLSSSIGANQKGLIMMQGLLDGLSTLPTSTYIDGDAVYLGATAGTITNVKPYAPNHLVYLGVVTTASPGAAGRMYVRVQNGYELDELHNVQAQTPTVNDVLYYFGGSPGQWKTASISTVLGYSPVGATDTDYEYLMMSGFRNTYNY